MKADAENIMEQLGKYNEDELFYKTYYEKKQNPAQLSNFIASLDLKWVEVNKIKLPELEPQGIPTLELDGKYVNVEIHKTVNILKHQRYTPEFTHRHTFFEFIYVLTGECKHTVSQRPHRMAKGDLCLLSPSVEHSIYVNDDSIVLNILVHRKTIDSVFFNLLRGESVLSDFFISNLYLKNFPSYLLFHTGGDFELRDCILEMYNENNREDAFTDSIVSSMLMVFFIKLIRKYKADGEAVPFITMPFDQPAKLIRLILENYPGITLSGLARRLNYSEVYCSKYIKKLTGYKFSEIIKTVRLKKAKDYIVNTSMSVCKISELLGYRNPENFIRAFKQEYGCPPGRLRDDSLRG